jgi:cellulose synthase/poly-beta-1,6-N-acetylglucosamine synthase-like glycosyltransferase
VLLPVYNGADLVCNAIESVLEQSWHDFELLIIDDGSTDTTARVVAGYGDPRIRLEQNDRNLGLTATLNLGLDMARGKYIARMDADDICHPLRLERQIRFLDTNAETGVVGSWTTTVAARADYRTATRAMARGFFFKMLRMDSHAYFPRRDSEIRFLLLFNNALSHPSVMFRRTLMDEHDLRYDESFPYAEDYEFWSRCSQHTQLANIPEVLLTLRKHSSNTSEKYAAETKVFTNIVRVRQLENSGIEMNQSERDLHRELANFDFAGDLDDLSAAKLWLEKLVEFAIEKLGVDRECAARLVSLYWYRACGATADEGIGAWRLSRSPEFVANLNWWPFMRRYRLLGSCLIHRSTRI